MQPQLVEHASENAIIDRKGAVTDLVCRPHRSIPFTRRNGEDYVTPKREGCPHNVYQADKPGLCQ